MSYVKGAKHRLGGDIADIFPPNSDAPYRISFFDDDIESIRSFDADTPKVSKGSLRVSIWLPLFWLCHQMRGRALTPCAPLAVLTDFSRIYRHSAFFGFFGKISTT